MKTLLFYYPFLYLYHPFSSPFVPFGRYQQSNSTSDHCLRSVAEHASDQAYYRMFDATTTDAARGCRADGFVATSACAQGSRRPAILSLVYQARVSVTVRLAPFTVYIPTTLSSLAVLLCWSE